MLYAYVMPEARCHRRIGETLVFYQFLRPAATTSNAMSTLLDDTADVAHPHQLSERALGRTTGVQYTPTPAAAPEPSTQWQIVGFFPLE